MTSEIRVLKLILGNNAAALGPSGSSEGVIASTPEKWINLPVLAGDKVLGVNDQLVVTLETAGAATLDASDWRQPWYWPGLVCWYTLY